MIKINTTIYDLDFVCKRFKVGDIIATIDELQDVKNDLEEVKSFIMKDTTTLTEYLEDVIAIEEQLVLLNKNIKTFEEAFMYNSAKVFERSIKIRDLGMICNN